MKKISLLFVLLLVLSACGNSSIAPVNKETLFTINGNKITEEDTFNSMKLSSGAIQVIEQEAQKILFASLVEEDDIFNKKVEDELNKVKELLGDNFDLLLKQNGFDSEEDYVNAIVKPGVKQEIALTKVMSEDYENLTKYAPRLVEIIEIEEDEAQKVLDLAKEGMSLKELKEEYGKEDSIYTGEEIFLSEKSTLYLDVLAPILVINDEGLQPELIKGKKDDVKYIVKITNLDTEAIKDQAIAEFVTNKDLTKTYLNELYVKNNFKVYDQDIYDSLKEANPGMFK